MTAAMFLIRAGLILLFLCIFIYIILPDIVSKKVVKKDIDDLEQKSIDLLNEKQAIRGATKKTQQKIDNITKNLEK